MPGSSLPADVLHAYGRFDGEPDAVQLATSFHLTDADHEILATQVTSANRLGLALELSAYALPAPSSQTSARYHPASSTMPPRRLG